MDTLNDFIADNQEKLMNSLDRLDKSTVKLESVGCAFDPDTLLVFAISHDGKVHNYDGVHITDVTEEWTNKLSNMDNWILF